MRILRATLWLVSLWLMASATFAQSGNFIRYHPPQFTVPSGQQLLLPDGSASAPSLAFASDTDNGLYYASSGRYVFAANTSDIMGLSYGFGLVMASNYPINWATDTTPGTGGVDLTLARDAANTLALRNSTNAQTFNIYNTYTDGSNYERATLGWVSNDFVINPNAGGSGTARAIRLKSSNAIYTEAVLVPTSDDNATYTLGAASIKWSSLYLSRSIQGSKTKALTDGAATDMTLIAIPDATGVVGTLNFGAIAKNATDVQALANTATIAAVNDTDVEQCGITSDNEVEVGATGTLTCSIGCDTDETNAVMVTLNCDSNLASQTSFVGYIRYDLLTTSTLTPQ